MVLQYFSRTAVFSKWITWTQGSMIKVMVMNSVCIIKAKMKPNIPSHLDNAVLSWYQYFGIGTNMYFNIFCHFSIILRKGRHRKKTLYAVYPATPTHTYTHYLPLLITNEWTAILCNKETIFLTLLEPLLLLLLLRYIAETLLIALWSSLETLVTDCKWDCVSMWP